MIVGAQSGKYRAAALYPENSVDWLKDAQANPDKYRDLVVRVAGFVELHPDGQKDLISRTELALQEPVALAGRGLKNSKACSETHLVSEQACF